MARVSIAVGVCSMGIVPISIAAGRGLGAIDDAPRASRRGGR
jgi:hypothetical protein